MNDSKQEGLTSLSGYGERPGIHRNEGLRLSREQDFSQKRLKKVALVGQFRLL